MQYQREIKPMDDYARDVEENSAAEIVTRFVRFVALSKRLKEGGSPSAGAAATGIAKAFGNSSKNASKKKPKKKEGMQAERRHRARRRSSIIA
jgi:hypothetical protein